jgi:hypothetical protein
MLYNGTSIALTPKEIIAVNLYGTQRKTKDKTMTGIQINHRDTRLVCHEKTVIGFARFTRTQFFDGHLCDFSPNGVNFEIGASILHPQECP